MKKKFKVNEVANTFNISRQTLVYYDKINLFKPQEIDKETLYRYYSEEQFFTLNFILTLKKAGLSLKEIKEYINTPSAEDSLVYLKKKEAEVEERILALEETKKIIKIKIKETKKVLIGATLPKVINYSFGRVFLKQNINSPLSSNKEETKLRHLVNFTESKVTFNKIINLKKKLGIDNNKLIELVDVNDSSYFGIKEIGFIIPNDSPYINGETVITPSKYATITYRGPWKDIEESYVILREFIKQNNYTIIGDAIEHFNEFSVHLGDGEGGKIDIYIPIK